MNNSYDEDFIENKSWIHFNKNSSMKENRS